MRSSSHLQPSSMRRVSCCGLGAVGGCELWVSGVWQHGGSWSGPAICST